MDDEQVRHLSVTFEDGATITLPAEIWADQTLICAMLGAIRGREPARMSDEDWTAFVWTVADKAAEEEA